MGSMNKSQERGMTDRGKLERGVAEFNARRFFEAHEAWEELWLAAPEPEKTHLQGLIQIAAAFHHYERGNERGAGSLLAAAIARLAACPDDFRGIAMIQLRAEVEEWLKILGSGSAGGREEVPKIRTVRAGQKEKRGD